MASTSGSRSVWSLPEVVDYFMADSEISTNVSAEELGAMVNYNVDWVKLVRTALEYQGFDPRVILSQMLRNRKSYIDLRPASLAWDLSNVGDDLRMRDDTTDDHKFTNEETLTRDVTFLITVFLSRNNHISKIVRKARGGVEDILNMLKEKYDINDDVNRSGTALESRTITLPRIAGVFPGTAVRMFHDKSVKEIVTYENYPGSLKPESHSICCPLLPSVCPMDLLERDGNCFHPVMIWTAVRLDDIIHRKDKNVTPLIDLLGYYRAGFQSAAVPEKSRQTIFLHLGLVQNAHKTSHGPPIVLTNQSKSLSTACLKALETMRLDDENHSVMMNVARTGDMNIF